jgi:hypothetical protein
MSDPLCWKDSKTKEFYTWLNTEEHEKELLELCTQRIGYDTAINKMMEKFKKEKEVHDGNV